jgi:hypothetical protein
MDTPTVESFAERVSVVLNLLALLTRFRLPTGTIFALWFE